MQRRNGLCIGFSRGRSRVRDLQGTVSTGKLITCTLAKAEPLWTAAVSSPGEHLRPWETNVKKKTHET